VSTLDPGAAPTLLAEGFVFAEGPRWRGDKLWLSDMHGEAVYSTTLTGKKTLEVRLPGKKPSGLGFLPNGQLLIVSMADRQLLRLDPAGTCVVHARLDALVADELNDMVVAKDGTAFVGSYPKERGTGVIVRVTPDGSADVVARELDFPNGSVITSDGRTLIVTESIGRRFTAFDIDSQNNLHGRRVIATTPDAAADGIALDAEEGIWAAFPLAHEFRRVLPGGEIADRIPLGDRMAIACALGGDDRRTLFLLSALDWSAKALEGTRTSTVQTVRVGVPGAGIP
jgi:sugar lactone lactonase YvrE